MSAIKDAIRAAEREEGKVSTLPRVNTRQHKPAKSLKQDKPEKPEPLHKQCPVDSVAEVLEAMGGQTITDAQVSLLGNSQGQYLLFQKRHAELGRDHVVQRWIKERNALVEKGDTKGLAKLGDMERVVRDAQAVRPMFYAKMDENFDACVRQCLADVLDQVASRLEVPISEKEAADKAFCRKYAMIYTESAQVATLRKFQAHQRINAKKLREAKSHVECGDVRPIGYLERALPKAELDEIERVAKDHLDLMEKANQAS